MKINLVQLSTKELAALSQRVIAVSAESTFTVVKNNPLLDIVKQEYGYYDKVYAKKAFSGRSEELIKADNNRDTPFGAMKSILLGHSRATGSPYQKEATELYSIFEKYGIAIDRLKFAEESAQMIKLIEELEAPENTTKIDHLLLTSVMLQLKTAQQKFEALFNELADENAELRQTLSATSQRKSMEKALRNYLNVVIAMKDIAEWKTLYSKLDEMVKAVTTGKNAKTQDGTEK